MEEAIVIGLLIISAVATRFYQISNITNDATYVTIVVLVLKVIFCRVDMVFLFLHVNFHYSIIVLFLCSCSI
jgi:hypothetical protein